MVFHAIGGIMQCDLILDDGFFRPLSTYVDGLPFHLLQQNFTYGVFSSRQDEASDAAGYEIYPYKDLSQERAALHRQLATWLADADVSMVVLWANLGVARQEILLYEILVWLAETRWGDKVSARCVDLAELPQPAFQEGTAAYYQRIYRDFSLPQNNNPLTPELTAGARNTLSSLYHTGHLIVRHKDVLAALPTNFFDEVIVSVASKHYQPVKVLTAKVMLSLWAKGYAEVEDVVIMSRILFLASHDHRLQVRKNIFDQNLISNVYIKLK
ncbi:hypothetical protein AU490_08285 [Lonsdalea populi]|uniref:Uncharacterized protein n=3 Tax=Pectobacteriaceae TaxID=1903410 RepID=A0ACD1JAK2_9GAMM|nr:hypothetical protein AU499_05950 [Lonsdalea populi]RAT12512.1 hypothetical protein AU485_11460 [Lonsdalea quercina]RAT14436.1 hypothetical protein AU486_12675 [Lonsdalea quercina]RAT20450.1 hypothetical protein AU487_08005 [Lonsdalea populi]RAT20544.1 hypothetical protein AU489_16010 [Lonsdalea populi]